jgi:hypothetical protein
MKTYSVMEQVKSPSLLNNLISGLSVSEGLSNPPYIFIAYYLVKHCESFTRSIQCLLQCDTMSFDKQLLRTKQHGFLSQKTYIFINTTVRTSDLLLSINRFEKRVLWKRPTKTEGLLELPISFSS